MISRLAVRMKECWSDRVVGIIAAGILALLVEKHEHLAIGANG